MVVYIALVLGVMALFLQVVAGDMEDRFAVALGCLWRSWARPGRAEDLVREAYQARLIPSSSSLPGVQ